jgi:hypothetical protein
MLTDGRADSDDDTSDGGLQFDRGHPMAQVDRSRSIRELLLGSLIGLPQRLSCGQVCLGLTLVKLCHLQFPRQLGVLFAQRAHAAQDLLRLIEGHSRPDGRGWKKRMMAS